MVLWKSATLLMICLWKYARKQLAYWYGFLCLFFSSVFSTCSMAIMEEEFCISFFPHCYCLSSGKIFSTIATELSLLYNLHWWFSYTKRNILTNFIHNPCAGSYETVDLIHIQILSSDVFMYLLSTLQLNTVSEIKRLFRS